MKKIFFMLAMLTMTLAANAQFEAGTTYVNTSVSGLGASYNGHDGGKLGISGLVGYFVDDCWMVDAMVGYNVTGKSSNLSNQFQVGAGGRYYILQNGLYLGVNAKLVLSSGYNDLLPGVEVGYCFYLNDKVSIEPALYYDQSFKNHSDYSTVGLKVGLGFYF